MTEIKFWSQKSLLYEVKCNLTKLTNKEHAVSGLSGQRLLALNRLKSLYSQTLWHGVRYSYHGGISGLFSKFFSFHLFLLLAWVSRLMVAMWGSPAMEL